MFKCKILLVGKISHDNPAQPYFCNTAQFLYAFIICFLFLFPACRNKKLNDKGCPTCKKTCPENMLEYYGLAQVVIQRENKQFITQKLFLQDLRKLMDIPDLQPDPFLRDLLVSALPINARAVIANGGIMIFSVKRKASNWEKNILWCQIVKSFTDLNFIIMRFRTVCTYTCQHLLVSIIYYNKL